MGADQGVPVHMASGGPASTKTEGTFRKVRTASSITQLWVVVSGLVLR